jgi:hypothetical protein
MIYVINFIARFWKYDSTDNKEYISKNLTVYDKNCISETIGLIPVIIEDNMGVDVSIHYQIGDIISKSGIHKVSVTITYNNSDITNEIENCQMDKITTNQ